MEFATVKNVVHRMFFSCHLTNMKHKAEKYTRTLFQMTLLVHLQTRTVFKIIR